MNFNTSITFVLTQLAVAYRTSLEKAMNEIGLHSGQIFVLMELWKDDGQSQVDLVKGLNLAAPTVNKMIKSLASNGFVECRACSSDGRLSRVFLTNKGAQIKGSVAEQWNIFEEHSYSSLTDTEKLMLTQLLSKLKENLSQNKSSNTNNM